MNLSAGTLLQALMLVTALSLDAFVASFAYGSNKIKIPFLSMQLINLICSAILGLSLLAGNFLSHYIPPTLTIWLSFGLLFALGAGKLIGSMVKQVLKRHKNLKKEIKFSLFNLRFILRLCAAPEEADIDASKTLSLTEAASLAVALSLDGLAIGIGASMADVNGILVILCSLVSDMLAVVLGCYIGNKAAQKLSVDLSWIGGVLLILLAFFKLCA